MTVFSRTTLLSAAALAAGLFVTSVAHADTTLFDSQGFESGAGYGPNTFLGSDTRWAESLTDSNGDGFPFSAIYIYDGALPSSANRQYVQVRVNSDPGEVTYTSPTTYRPPNAPYVAVPGQKIVVRWTMTALSAGAVNDAFAGIQAFNGDNPVATAGVDIRTGTIVGVSDAGAVPFAALPNTPYFYQLLLDYDAQSYTISAAPAISSTTPLTVIGSAPFQSTAGAFTDAAITGFVLGTQAAAGNANFDDYSVTAVPEPAALSILAAGGILLMRRRRAVDKAV